MPKLLDQHNKQPIIERILKLNAGSNGLWGNMTVNEMLFHCKIINHEILESKQPDKSPTIKQKIIKIIGLYLMKGFPKGIKTGAKYLPQQTDNLNFLKLQNELVDNVNYIANYNGAIYGVHPMFGSLNTKEWRRFIWKHLDHHLRQFNT